MAHIRIPDENRRLSDQTEITQYLADFGIDYERWEPSQPFSAEASSEEILAAYAPEIERLKQRGGYVTADVINVNAQTPGLETMLAKFNREHWHDEDEVRYIIDFSLSVASPKRKGGKLASIAGGNRISLG